MADNGNGGGGSGGGLRPGGAAGMPTQRNTSMCPSFVGARVVRMTRLNACGAPMFGRENQVTTRGIVTASFEPEIEEGESLDTKNLNGELCVQGSTPSTMAGIDVTLEFCQVDPSVFAIMNPNWKVVRNSRNDYSGDITGFRISSNVSDEFGFALELWPKTLGAAGNACEADEDPDPSDPWNVHGYFLLPFVSGVVPEEWEITGDEVATFSLKGRTKGGSGWDVGPYAVTRDEAQHPSPLLRPIEDGSGKGKFKHPVTGQIMRDPDHFHAEIVSVTPPEPSCGAQDLIRPKLCTTQEGREVRVTLLNADEIAPADPVSGERPPVWISWGDGSNRTNLTAPEHAGPLPPECDENGDGGGGDEEPPPDDGDGDNGTEPDVRITQDDEQRPRRVTAEAVEFPDGVDELTVDWGADVQPVGGEQPNVRVTQAEQAPRRVTASADPWPDGVDEITVDWGADVQPIDGGGGDGPVRFQQKPDTPRVVTAEAIPAPRSGEEITVEWGADVQPVQETQQ